MDDEIGCTCLSNLDHHWVAIELNLRWKNICVCVDPKNYQAYVARMSSN